MSAVEVPYGTCHCGCGEKTNIAIKTANDRGHVKGQPKRYVNNHHVRHGPVDYLEEDRGYKTPCWIWQRSLMRGGYGSIGRRGGTPRGAHRLYYEQANGPLPKDVQLDHLCRVRACVNPDHLEPVTNAVNVQRGLRAKLTADDVRRIRRSSASRAALAAEFGITVNYVGHILTRRTWRNV